MDDVVLRCRADAVACHPCAQSAFEILHPLHRPPHSHGAAQLFGLCSRETGNCHCHAKKLLLEERHSKSALQHWFKGRMRIGNFFLSLAAAHIRVHHLADDGAGADDGYLHDEVVEACGRVVRYGSHLRAALHLKHSHGVRLAQRLVDKRVFGQHGKIHVLAVMARNQLNAILENGHHAQTEQVHFDEAEVCAVLLVPLDHGAAWHGGALDGDDAVEHSGADDHAARVLAEMTRQILHSQA